MSGDIFIRGLSSGTKWRPMAQCCTL